MSRLVLVAGVLVAALSGCAGTSRSTPAPPTAEFWHTPSSISVEPPVPRTSPDDRREGNIYSRDAFAALLKKLDAPGYLEIPAPSGRVALSSAPGTLTRIEPGGARSLATPGPLARGVFVASAGAARLTLASGRVLTIPAGHVVSIGAVDPMLLPVGASPTTTDIPGDPAATSAEGAAMPCAAGYFACCNCVAPAEPLCACVRDSGTSTAVACRAGGPGAVSAGVAGCGRDVSAR